MIYIGDDSAHLETKLREFSSSLGFIFPELLKTVGEKMKQDAQVNAPVNTGKLSNNIRFLIDNRENSYALTTRKKLGNTNVWYSNIREHGANITAKKSEYLMFKIDGEWKKVKSVRTPAQPFMKPVFEEYFGNGSSKGYTELANALLSKMENELK